MAREAEVSTIDLRYEGYRTKSPAQEARLLVSIQERGVEEALQGVEVGGKRILLDGFKRYRCARRLGLGHVPWVSLGEDEAAGIVTMIRASNHRSLGILEQARFIDDLVQLHRMAVAEVAETLSRSKSWVTMRLGLIREMGEVVREKVFAGAFPVYSYMYTLRPFLRRHGVGREDVEAFVLAVSGKKLSIREIEQLAHGYFRGPEWFRGEVESGNLALALDQMRRASESPEGCNDFERVLLKDLETLSKSMLRVTGKSLDARIKTGAFCSQANLLLAGILSRFVALRKALEALHDRTREA